MIIAAYAGTGKSYYVKNHKNDSIDLNSMRYTWILPDTEEFNEENESIKAARWLLPNPVFPINYIQQILEANQKYKYVMVPPILGVLAYLNRHKIPYVLVYPNINAKEEYHERYLSRGNTQSFLDVFIDQFEERINTLMEDNKAIRHIILQKGQFIEDVLEKELSDLELKKDEYSSEIWGELEELSYDVQYRKKHACVWFHSIDDTLDTYYYPFDMEEEDLTFIYEVGKRCYEKGIKVRSQYDVDFVKLLTENCNNKIFSAKDLIIDKTEKSELIELKSREELLDFIENYNCRR